MSTIKVIHNIDSLAADAAQVSVKARADMPDVVRRGIRAGNRVAADFAKRSAGEHGKHYYRSFTAEMRPVFNLFGARIISGEYGPDIARPQGGMSFEFGSRNQKPHLDLARSADLIGGSLAREVSELPDRWFW